MSRSSERCRGDAGPVECHGQHRSVADEELDAEPRRDHDDLQLVLTQLSAEPIEVSLNTESKESAAIVDGADFLEQQLSPFLPPLVAGGEESVAAAECLLREGARRVRVDVALE